jgi:hypothetical protein
VPFEIRYKHSMMPDGYVGKCIKHAHTKEQALKYFAPKKPCKKGWTRTKQKAAVKILSVNEIPTE